MIKTNLSFRAILWGGISKSLKIKKIVNRMPVSPHVKFRELKNIDTFEFTEVRIMQNDTRVTRRYRINDKVNNATLIKKNILRNKDDIEYMTRYSDKGNFVATLRCDEKKYSYTTFLKDKEAGKMLSVEGLGAYNRA